jgi:hypothetical protein
MQTIIHGIIPSMPNAQRGKGQSAREWGREKGGVRRAGLTETDGTQNGGAVYYTVYPSIR